MGRKIDSSHPWKKASALAVSKKLIKIDKHRASSKKRSARICIDLADPYIKNLIADKTKMARKDITKEMIESYREDVRLRRESKLKVNQEEK